MNNNLGELEKLLRMYYYYCKTGTNEVQVLKQKANVLRLMDKND